MADQPAVVPWRRPGRTGLALAAALLLLLALPAAEAPGQDGHAAPASPRSPQATSTASLTGPGIRPPAASMVPENTNLYATACQRHGACWVGGNYQRASGQVEPLIARPGHTGFQLRLPGDVPREPAGEPYGEVTGLACTDRTCTAVGDYVERVSSASLYYGAFLATEFHGVWRTYLPLLPPHAAPAASQSDTLSAVDCTYSGFCEAVGNYVDKNGQQELMALSKPRHRRWGRAVEVKPPDTPSHHPPKLSGLACPQPGDCVAAGLEQTATGQYVGLGVSETDGHWHHAQQSPVPAGAFRQGAFVDALRSVSCPDPQDCVAVGSYAISGSQYRAMSVLVSHGHFLSATAIPAVPPGADSKPTTDLAAVSCLSLSECVAVGQGTNKIGRYVALEMVLLNGSWKASYPPPLANARLGTFVASSLFSVTCRPAGRCVAAGAYNDDSGGIRGRALFLTPFSAVGHAMVDPG